MGSKWTIRGFQALSGNLGYEFLRRFAFAQSAFIGSPVDGDDLCVEESHCGTIGCRGLF